MGTKSELTSSPHHHHPYLTGYHRPIFSPALFRPADSGVGKTMPESSVDSKYTPSATSPIMPPVSSSTAVLRPLSHTSSMSGPLHSPHSSLNGRTPSPAGPMSGAGAGAGQQLPPACGARQLSKLKRFLTTLIQFGSDISMDIGDRVRGLVLALVNNHLSIEEFHSKLQEATNFPLRPFVIPFLKANLPLLQRELLHCARMAKQTPQQYLAHNQHVIFDPAHSPLDPSNDQSSGSRSGSAGGHPHHQSQSHQHHHRHGDGGVNENGKRRSSPDRSHENGYNENDPPPSKRPSSGPPPPCSSSSSTPHFPSPASLPPPHHPQQPSGCTSLAASVCEQLRVPGETSTSRHFNFPGFPPSSSSAVASLSSSGGRHDGLTGPASSSAAAVPTSLSSSAVPESRSYDRHIDNHIDRIEDEWRHVENMLHCIMDMVGRCRRALTALQEKAQHDREDLATWLRRHGSAMDSDIRKRADMMADSLRHTEDRVNEVRRRAVYDFPEEAVAEVKRQAVAELQKAVAAAESKAAELVAVERNKMDTAISKARAETAQEVMSRLNHQEESSESCWNCGRKAHETCSGCNIARYCGPFCQHKDWESHHRVCVPRPPAPTEIRPQNSPSTSSPPPPRASSVAVSSPGAVREAAESRSSPKLVGSPHSSNKAERKSRSASSSPVSKPIVLKEEPKSQPSSAENSTSSPEEAQ